MKYRCYATKNHENRNVVNLRQALKNLNIFLTILNNIDSKIA